MWNYGSLVTRLLLLLLTAFSASSVSISFETRPRQTHNGNLIVWFYAEGLWIMDLGSAGMRVLDAWLDQDTLTQRQEEVWIKPPNLQSPKVLYLSGHRRKLEGQRSGTEGLRSTSSSQELVCSEEPWLWSLWLRPACRPRPAKTGREAPNGFSPI